MLPDARLPAPLRVAEAAHRGSSRGGRGRGSPCEPADRSPRTMQQALPRSLGATRDDRSDIEIAERRLGAEPGPRVGGALDEEDTFAGHAEAQPVRGVVEIDDVRLPGGRGG